MDRREEYSECEEISARLKEKGREPNHCSANSQWSRVHSLKDAHPQRPEGETKRRRRLFVAAHLIKR